MKSCTQRIKRDHEKSQSHFRTSLKSQSSPSVCSSLRCLCCAPAQMPFPHKELKEPWVQLCIVVWPYWETKPVIGKKPQYQQGNFVLVVFGNHWHKIWLEVTTGPRVSSLHPCHPRCEPFFLFSLFSVLPDSRGPANPQLETSCGFVLWLPRDRAVIFLGVPRA